MSGYRLQVHGIKGHDLDLLLGRLNVIVADNGAGKSTAILALQFLALGYVPAYGKRLIDMARLLSDRKAAVILTFPDGRVATRTIERTEKGLASRAHLSWLADTAKPADHDRELLALFGADQTEVAEALDVRELLTATESQRAARLARLLTSTTPVAELVDGIVRRTLQALVGIDDERMPANWRALEDMVTPAHAEAIAQAWPEIKAKLLATDIPATLAFANERKNAAQLAQRRKEQARTEIATRLENVPDADATRTAALEAERRTLDQTIGRLAEQQRSAAARATARREAEGAVAEAEATRDRVARERMAWVEERDGAYDPAPALGMVEANLDALTAPAAPDDTEARDLETQIATSERLRDAIQLPTVPALDAERAAVTAATEALTAHDASPWAEVLRRAQAIAAGLGSTKKDQGIRAEASALAALAVTHGKPERRVELDDARQQAERALGAAEERARQAATVRESAEGERGALEVHLTALREQLTAARTLPASYTEARDAYDRRRAELTAERDTLREAAEVRTTRERETSDALTAADATLAAARAKLDGIGNDAAPATIDAELVTARSRHHDVVAELETLQANAARRAELDGIVRELTALGAQREVLAAIEGALREARDQAVQAAGGPLLERLNLYLRGAGRKEVAGIHEGRDLGWLTPDGKPVDVTVLSGAEWQLYTGGLAAALGTLRKAPFPAVLIEADACTRGTLQQIVAGIGAVAEGLALVIVCTPHLNGPSREVDGWNLVALERGAASEAA